MKHIGLFEGIGGFSEGIEAMGWETIAWCEWNEFGQFILSDKYPNAIAHGDITKTDFTVYRGKCDIVTGGFPCQPYSTAGKRLGKDDERHLWPEMLRAIREIGPRYVVGENVSGLISWNGGLVFDEVQADLEAAGYEVIPFVLPAAGVGAPHRRDRVWFVAFKNTNKDGWRSKQWESQTGERQQRYTGAGDYERVQTYDGEIRLTTDTESISQRKQANEIEPVTVGGQTWAEPCSISGGGIIADTSSLELQRGQQYGGIGKKRKIESEGRQSCRSVCNQWQNFPTQSPVRTGNDGLPTESLRQRIREDSMGFLSEEEIEKILSAAAGRWRKETIKAAGNAIVPQVFLQICKAIQQFESLSKPTT